MLKMIFSGKGRITSEQDLLEFRCDSSSNMGMPNHPRHRIYIIVVTLYVSPFCFMVAWAMNDCPNPRKRNVTNTTKTMKFSIIVRNTIMRGPRVCVMSR